jgi:hypothetical protein
MDTWMDSCVNIYINENNKLKSISLDFESRLEKNPGGKDNSGGEKYISQYSAGAK